MMKGFDGFVRLKNALRLEGGVDPFRSNYSGLGVVVDCIFGRRG